MESMRATMMRLQMQMNEGLAKSMVRCADLEQQLARERMERLRERSEAFTTYAAAVVEQEDVPMEEPRCEPAEQLDEPLEPAEQLEPVEPLDEPLEQLEPAEPLDEPLEPAEQHEPAEPMDEPLEPTELEEPQEPAADLDEPASQHDADSDMEGPSQWSA